jgi:class 3 adenylate cyclase
MSTLDDLQKEVASIFRTQWDITDGRVIPDSNALQLGNHGIQLEGTVLYADLIDSTELVEGYKAFFAAEIYKAYLSVACRIIRANGGEITAFDGDRVMAVYIDGNKNSSAAKSALQINWAVQKVINPAIKKQYPNTAFTLQQVVGIDTSSLLAARTGIRGSNDIVWVGNAANHAAKLCSIRETSYSSFITEAVWKKLSEPSKFGGSPKRDMWQKTIWSATGQSIYRSSWRWPL